MLQASTPGDFVISTGETNTLEQFVAEAFAAVGRDWHDHVRTDKSLYRPTDIAWSQGNPARAARELGWSAKLHMRNVVREMVHAEQSAMIVPTRGP
jgi:GDPmannose 4,6-dehydratase